MNTTEAIEKAKLIKNALKIVDELVRLDFDIIDGEPTTIEGLDVEKFEKLLIKADRLTKDRWWKLM